MTNVSLGEHSKLTANPVERDRVRELYTQVLGCPALFGDFSGTAGLSDFPSPFVIGVRP